MAFVVEGVVIELERDSNEPKEKEVDVPPGRRR